MRGLLLVVFCKLEKELLGAGIAEADRGLAVVACALYLDNFANAKTRMLDDVARD